MLLITFPYELNNKMMKTILLKHWALYLKFILL